MEILYKTASNGELRQWKAWVEDVGGGEYHLKVEAGVVYGKQVPTKGQVFTSGKQGRDAKGQAEFELASKVKKKRDEGYYDTIDEAKNNKKFLPMLAVNFAKRGGSVEYPAIGQRKFDGVRCLASLNDDGSVNLKSRRDKPFPHLNHLRQQIAGLPLEEAIILDGELYSDTLTFQEVVGLVRRESLKAGDEDKLKQISYRLYDLYDGDFENQDFEGRYAELAQYLNHNPSSHPNLILTENIVLNDPAEVKQYHDEFVKEGYEGIMVRNRKGEYGIDKRSKHLQKFKEFFDEEFEIVGFTEGTGNDAGTVIWYCMTDNGDIFKARPKGTREERKEWFENGQKHIGSTLTVRYFELTDDGIPRFPVGVAIRDYE